MTETGQRGPRPFLQRGRPNRTRKKARLLLFREGGSPGDRPWRVVPGITRDPGIQEHPREKSIVWSVCMGSGPAPGSIPGASRNHSRVFPQAANADGESQHGGSAPSRTREWVFYSSGFLIPAISVSTGTREAVFAKRYRTGPRQFSNRRCCQFARAAPVVSARPPPELPSSIPSLRIPAKLILRSSVRPRSES
jgi:hypothetical protein